MRKVFVMVLLLATIFPVVAQKAKIRSASFKYMHYPKKPLPKWVKTYSTEVTSTSTRLKVASDLQSTYLVLEGFEKAEPGTLADLTIVFELHSVKTNADIKTKEEKKKVDDKEVTITYYYHQVVSEVGGKFKIIDKNSKEIFSDVFSGSDFQNVENSSMYKTKSEAQADYNKNKNKIIKRSDEASLEKALSSCKKYMNNNHGYYYSNYSALVATGKGRKHDYTDLDETLAKFQEAAGHYSAGDKEKYKEMAIECIKVWETALEEYDAKNKKARISRKNADWFYFSIASAYLFLDEFDKALEYMDKGQAIDAGLQSKTAVTNIKDIKYRYQQNKAREEGKFD